jgi:hypothetical protein
VDDALVDAVDREIRNAEIADILLERVDLQLRFRFVDAGAAIARRDIVVGYGDRRIRRSPSKACGVVTSWIR